MLLLAGFVCGFIFGLGLLISGMTQPTKVLGFAVVKQRAPLLAPRNQWPSRTDIDRPLLIGSALFGIGWGLVGLCPGPALENLATLSPRVIVFVSAMAAGMVLHDFWQIQRYAHAELATAGAADG